MASTGRTDICIHPSLSSHFLYTVCKVIRLLQPFIKLHTFFIMIAFNLFLFYFCFSSMAFFHWNCHFETAGNWRWAVARLYMFTWLWIIFSNGISFCSSIVAVLISNVGFQLQYQLIFSIWMLTFNAKIAEQICEYVAITFLSNYFPVVSSQDFAIFSALQCTQICMILCAFTVYFVPSELRDGFSSWY